MSVRLPCCERLSRSSIFSRSPVRNRPWLVFGSTFSPMGGRRVANGRTRASSNRDQSGLLSLGRTIGQSSCLGIQSPRGLRVIFSAGLYSVFVVVSRRPPALCDDGPPRESNKSCTLSLQSALKGSFWRSSDDSGCRGWSDWFSCSPPTAPCACCYPSADVDWRDWGALDVLLSALRRLKSKLPGGLPPLPRCRVCGLP